jgi:hypothetical protein
MIVPGKLSLIFVSKVGAYPKFVPGKHFKPSLMIASKAGAYPKVSS